MSAQDEQNKSNKDSAAKSRDSLTSNREAASLIVRNRIDSIYEDKALESKTEHQQTTDTDSTDQWKQYHAAWQDYYRQYYERYYTGHLHRLLGEQHKAYTATLARVSEEAATSDAAHVKSTEQSESSQPESAPETVEGLRQTIRARAVKVARTARGSRHFYPIAAAVVVVLVVAFLQYNSVLMATVQAYVSPGAINPQNIIVDPSADPRVSPDPKLIIPKINVDVPVVYGIPYTGNFNVDNPAQMKGMEQGVIHFAMPGASSVPGQIGNTVISGHSSNDLFEPGEYKFVFAQIDKLEPGDTIYANYQGIRYTYTVTRKEIVKPSDGQKLAYATDKPVLTLVTCTPLGTSLNRLLVTAEQVAPDPAKAAAASGATASTSGAMPGNSPSALQRLFGGN